MCKSKVTFYWDDEPYCFSTFSDDSIHLADEVIARIKKDVKCNRAGPLRKTRVLECDAEKKFVKFIFEFDLGEIIVETQF